MTIYQTGFGVLRMTLKTYPKNWLKIKKWKFSVLLAQDAENLQKTGYPVGLIYPCLYGVILAFIPALFLMTARLAIFAGNHGRMKCEHLENVF